MLKNLIIRFVKDWENEKICNKTIIGIVGSIISGIVYIASIIGVKIIGISYEPMMLISAGITVTFLLVSIQGTKFDELKRQLYEEKEYLMKGRHFKEEG